MAFWNKKEEEQVQETGVVEIDPIAEVNSTVAAVSELLDESYEVKLAELKAAEVLLATQQTVVDDLRVEVERMENTKVVLETLLQTTAPKAEEVEEVTE